MGNNFYKKRGIENSIPKSLNNNQQITNPKLQINYNHQMIQ